MKKTFLIIVILIGLTGCINKYAYKPTKHVTKKYIPPESQEGKMCVMECEKIKLMKMQIATQEYMVNRINDRRNRWSNTDYAMKDVSETFTKIEYDRCYETCGGKIEKTVSTY
jgi:hypothetical protein